MSFVTVFMALTTAFVLLAPILMAAVLVTGGVPFQRMAPAPARASEADPERELSRVA